MSRALLFQPGDVVGTASVYGGASSEVPLTCDGPIKVFLARGGQERLTAKIVYRGPLAAPVAAGAEVATLESLARRDARARSAAAHADGDPARRPRQAGVRRRRRVRHRPHPRRAGEELMARAPAPGRFITLEGGEGAGKSVQARRLAARLATLGLSVVLTREPGGSPGAEALREVILSGGAARYGAIGEAILFSAARIDHIDATIAPALKRGEWVVCDRFLDSTRAYQGAAGRLDPALVASLERVAVGACRPDLTLMLDLPAGEGLARASARRGGAAADRFEGEGLVFHETLRRAFLAIVEAEPERCVLIDARPGEGEVAAAIWAAVRRAPRRGAQRRNHGEAMSRPASDAPPESDAFPGAPHPRFATRLVGHAAAEAAMLAAYREGRLAHAWLIGGREGIGKATLAWRFARFVLANPDPTTAAARNAPATSPSPPTIRRRASSRRWRTPISRWRGANGTPSRKASTRKSASTTCAPRCRCSTCRRPSAAGGSPSSTAPTISIPPAPMRC